MRSSVVTVGVDLAMTAPHVAIAIGGSLKGQKERVFEHSGEAIRGFVDWALKLAGSVEDLVVALESPHGGVVEELLDRGIPTYHLNPKQLDRFREQESVCGAKDDRRDARVLAERLRTDLKCFRLVTPSLALNVRLREHSRERSQLLQDFRGKANRLRDLLHRCSPELLKLCPAADEPWLWTVVETYPTPATAKNAKRGKLREFLATTLKAHRIRRLDPPALMDVMRASSVKLAPGISESAQGQIRRLAQALRLTHSQIKEVDQLIKAELSESAAEEDGPTGQGKQRDAAIVFSMPGVGPVIGATLLGEASRPIRDRDYTSLRALSGAAPVTRTSGKGRYRKTNVHMRRACNQHLRVAVHHWARVAARVDDSARAHYEACRSRGAGHNQALRTVADRLMRIMVAALEAGELYDPSRLRGRYARSAA